MSEAEVVELVNHCILYASVFAGVIIMLLSGILITLLGGKR